MTPQDRAAIEARDATTELMGDPISPPEGVVWQDSCVMRAYDRRALLAALATSEARAKALAEALIWASGADDFAPASDGRSAGKAREGWEKVAEPALRAYRDA